MTTSRSLGVEDTTEVRAVPRRSIGQKLLASGTVLALVLLILFFFAMRPDVFLSFTNVKNILYQVAILAIIAGAQTIVMVVGDFDLSVAATSALAGAVAASLMISGWPIALAIFAALIVGLLIGLANGLLDRLLNLSAFVATLATLTSVTGLAFIVTEGTTLFNLPPEFNNLGQGKFLEIPLAGLHRDRASRSSSGSSCGSPPSAAAGTRPAGTSRSRAFRA